MPIHLRACIGPILCGCVTVLSHAATAQAGGYGPQAGSGPAQDPIAIAPNYPCIGAVHSTEATRSPYCGVRSVILAARHLRPDVELVQLLRPEIVGLQGSTSEQLEEGARVLGLSGRTMRGLTYLSLSMIESPIVVHVKSNPTAQSFDHWAAMCTWSSNSVILSDGSQSPLVVSRADFRAMWDGEAILLSERNKSVEYVRVIVLLEIAAYGFIIVLGVVVLHIACKWLSQASYFTLPNGDSRAGTVVELALVLVLVFAAKGTSDVLGGGLQSDTGVNGVISFRVPELLDDISATELAARLVEPESQLVLIDARRRVDFESGHIVGAINVEPHVASMDYPQAIQQLPHDVPIVVYCRLRECGFSGVVARKLRQLGFTNIVLFRDGWLEWERLNLPATEEV